MGLLLDFYPFQYIHINLIQTDISIIKSLLFTFSYISNSVLLEGRYSVRYSVIQHLFVEHLPIPGTVLK